MNKLIISLFGLVVLASGQVVGQCQADSFELKAGDQVFPFTVDKLLVTMNVAISVKAGTDLNGKQEEEYVKECIDKIRFDITKAGGTTTTQDLDLPTSLNPSSMLLQLTGLDPLTQYSVTVSYIQKSPTNTPVEGYKQDINTCFDNPDKPRNLKLDIKNDGSGVLTWEAPETLNAPKLCRYVVSKRKGAKVEEIDQVEPDVLSKVIRKEDLESSDFIQVNAVNDLSCYIVDYPFAKDCKSTTLGRYQEIQILKTTTQPKTTTTTPNSSTRPNISYSIFFILPLLAFANL